LASRIALAAFAGDISYSETKGAPGGVAFAIHLTAYDTIQTGGRLSHGRFFENFHLWKSWRSLERRRFAPFAAKKNGGTVGHWDTGTVPKPCVFNTSPFNAVPAWDSLGQIRV